MSFLLKYMKNNGMQVEAIRATYKEAQNEAIRIRQQGAKAIVCFEVKEGVRIRAFYLINYGVCYTDKNGHRGIIRGCRWSYDERTSCKFLESGLLKCGYKYAKYFETPIPLVFNRVMRLSRLKTLKEKYQDDKYSLSPSKDLDNID